MLLKSLKLKDFRQFKGEQFIEFATDEEKNVTIILGENGSGKTSFAQAFTWCLYGKTDFDDPILLCKSTSQSMQQGAEELVYVSISLNHNEIDYIIKSELIFKKNTNSAIHPCGQRKFEISYKSKDGQTEFLNSLDADLCIKEILPYELSKYFFFDGERIGNMSKDIRRGKSREFAEAVRNLLGLSAYTSAIYHLKGSGTFKSVLRSYDDQFDAKADSRITDYTNKIDQLTSDIERIEARLIDMEHEEEFVDENIQSFSQRLRENENSKEFAERREALIKRRQALVSRKNNQTSDLLKIFDKNAPAYFTKILMHDSIKLLTSSNKIDKGIPDIHARTIDFLIKRCSCICGAEITVGSEIYNTLNKLRDFIPPQSLGNLIEQFRLSCESSVKNTFSFSDDFKEKYSEILSFDNDYIENENEISKISKRLDGMEDVGKIEAELKKYQKQQRSLKQERSDLDTQKGAAETNRDRIEKERHDLTLKDKNNQRVELFKTYARYIYKYISNDYDKEETRVREELSKTVDEIFRSIYNGGFSLSLDAKYNVQVNIIDNKDYNEYTETSTSQSISIIFAFIAGVIKMAKDSQNPENEMLVSEPYPLVMDAPLSAFDKTRIQTVCSVLPRIAEQVIIFIKDTDGEIAEKYLKDKLGSRAVFSKKNEFETQIEERSNYVI